MRSVQRAAHLCATALLSAAAVLFFSFSGGYAATTLNPGDNSAGGWAAFSAMVAVVGLGFAATARTVSGARRTAKPLVLLYATAWLSFGLLSLLEVSGRWFLATLVAVEITTVAVVAVAAIRRPSARSTGDIASGADTGHAA